jgi:hypothetical protein
MKEVAGGRYCGDCDKVVRDISAMREADARALLAAPRNERLCIRYLADRTGSIQFADSAPEAPLLPATFLARAKRAALLAVGVAAPLAAAACNQAPPVEEVMGDYGMPVEVDAGSPAPDASADGSAEAGDAAAEAAADAAAPDAGPDAEVDGSLLPN